MDIVETMSGKGGGDCDRNRNVCGSKRKSPDDNDSNSDGVQHERLAKRLRREAALPVATRFLLAHVSSKRIAFHVVRTPTRLRWSAERWADGGVGVRKRHSGTLAQELVALVSTGGAYCDLGLGGWRELLRYVLAMSERNGDYDDADPDNWDLAQQDRDAYGGTPAELWRQFVLASGLDSGCDAAQRAYWRVDTQQAARNTALTNVAAAAADAAEEQIVLTGAVLEAIRKRDVPRSTDVYRCSGDQTWRRYEEPCAACDAVTPAE